VDERVGVQHLQRGAEFFYACGKGTGDYASSLHTEDRPQALASGEDAVAHGFVDRDRMFGFERDEAVERSVGALLSLFESFLQHEW
jgi:hypothetical protein